MTLRPVEAKNHPYLKRDREIKEHEKEMLRLIHAATHRRPIDVLDVGCADGLFLEAVSRELDCRTVHGLDNDPELVSVARKRPYRAERSAIVIANASALAGHDNLQDLTRYDVIIASGILPFFEDQDRMVGAMCRYLKDDGSLFVFNKIISADVDMKYAVRATGSASWVEERFIPSLKTLTDAMQNHLRDVRVQRFELAFDLAPSASNVHSTRTVRTVDGSRMLVTGYNLVSELAFLYGQRR